MLDSTGYRSELESSNDPQDLARLDNLNELVSVAHEFSIDRANAAAIAEEGSGLDDDDVPDTGVLAEFLERVSLVAETLGSSSGVGYRLRQAADLIQTDQVFAWTLTLVVMMAALEMGVLRPLEDHLFRWKKEAENQ